MADCEGTQDFVEDFPTGQPVDKGGRAQQGDENSQHQLKQGGHTCNLDSIDVWVFVVCSLTNIERNEREERKERDEREEMEEWLWKIMDHHGTSWDIVEHHGIKNWELNADW